LTFSNENGYHFYMKPVPEANTSPNQEVASSPFRGGRVVSDRLLGERGELVIEHNGREYRLRLTHSGKLILTA
jgi:hemin uptake protein HemP